MTEDERKMLLEAHEMYEALMKPTVGGKPPLIQRMGEVCDLKDNARWAGKAFIWGLPTLAAIGASVQAVLSWFSNGQGAGQ